MAAILSRPQCVSPCVTETEISSWLRNLGRWLHQNLRNCSADNEENFVSDNFWYMHWRKFYHHDDIFVSASTGQGPLFTNLD